MKLPCVIAYERLSDQRKQEIEEMFKMLKARFPNGIFTVYDFVET